MRVLDFPSFDVLPKFVASVISKRVSGKTYYYLATSARVGGKPRIVEQRYLGTAAEIEAAMDDIIDEVTGGRRADAGASVGTYLA